MRRNWPYVRSKEEKSVEGRRNYIYKRLWGRREFGMEDLSQWLSTFRAKECLKTSYWKHSQFLFLNICCGKTGIRDRILYFLTNNSGYVVWEPNFEDHCSKGLQPQVKNLASLWLSWSKKQNRKRSLWNIILLILPSFLPLFLLLFLSTLFSVDAGNYSRIWRYSSRQNGPEY